MKKAMLITVGNTADPILKAIEEARAEGEEVTIFLLYGRPFPGQNPSPFDVAYQARQKGEEMGIAVQPREAADPEDLNTCLAAARDILREAADAEQVVVNFTGGTKALSAAVVHAALTESLSGELILDYTGGKVHDQQGQVLREEMRVKRSERTATNEILQQVLQRLRRGNYREARLLVERLPENGLGGFVRQATEGLYLWDEFDYEAAVQVFRRLHRPASVLSDDERLSPLAGLVNRLLEPGNALCELFQALRKAQEGQAGIRKEFRHFPLLVADVLENSLRRLREDRPTDSVLRSYRAVEAAVQAQLLKKDINPWRPDWQRLGREMVERYLALQKATQPPKDLALSAGLTLLEAMGQGLREEAHKWRDDIRRSRNESYLEHGYVRLRREDAERLNGYAVALCAELLGDSLDALRASVCHSW